MVPGVPLYGTAGTPCPNFPISQFLNFMMQKQIILPHDRPFAKWFQLCFHYNSLLLWVFLFFLSHECLMKHRQLRFSATEHDDENTPRRREIQDSMFKKKKILKEK